MKSRVLAGGCAVVVLLTVVWIGSWFYYQAESANLVDEMYQRISYPMSITDEQVTKVNASLEATPYEMISDETKTKVKTISSVLTRTSYLRLVVAEGAEITYYNGKYYANGVLIDENGLYGNGYGSIIDPTPMASLATNAETGEPISSEPNGAWEGLVDA